MRSPYATFSHGPENEEDVKHVTSDDKFIPRTRAEIIESDAFRSRLGEKVRDELTDEQCAILATYLSRGDSAEAGRYLGEMMVPMTEYVVAWIRKDDEYNGNYVRV